LAGKIEELYIGCFDLKNDVYKVSPPKLEDVIQAFCFVGRERIQRL
jgi:hypothetical protein